jgi:hypothetical protein
MNLETWELLSYVVTVIGLPLAIAVFILQQRKERRAIGLRVAFRQLSEVPAGGARTH